MTLDPGMPFNFVNGTIADADEVNENFEAVWQPVGSIVAWLKTFSLAIAGVNTAVAANKLIDGGGGFAAAVEVDYIVENNTDNTFSYCTVVDLDTQLSLNADIFPAPFGDNYNVWQTPRLNEFWVECNGNAIVDADSPYNGTNTPNLNGTPSFLRGNTVSGGTGGSDTHNHWVFDAIGGGIAGITQGGGTSTTFNNAGGVINYSSATDCYTNMASTLPVYYEVVWIMRIK